MTRPKDNTTSHLAPQLTNRSKAPRSAEQIERERLRQKMDLIKDARELGEELCEVWDE